MTEIGRTDRFNSAHLSHYDSCNERTYGTDPDSTRGPALQSPGGRTDLDPTSNWLLLGSNDGKPYKGKGEKQKNTTRVKIKASSLNQIHPKKVHRSEICRAGSFCAGILLSLPCAGSRGARSYLHWPAPRCSDPGRQTGHPSSALLPPSAAAAANPAAGGAHLRDGPPLPAAPFRALRRLAVPLQPLRSPRPEPGRALWIGSSPTFSQLMLILLADCLSAS
ncbi:uncharacterized protein LOC131835455 [Mustela lutreola]|uniref:uncharacterized protein LOC131835455 n=1 Tax=Mustela lutreola TaxID=9666 RepID=UPI002797483B|nr:uncharacterized protein LOC131835455 [Mustela lutreola]